MNHQLFAIVLLLGLVAATNAKYIQVYVSVGGEDVPVRIDDRKSVVELAIAAYEEANPYSYEEHLYYTVEDDEGTDYDLDDSIKEAGIVDGMNLVVTYQIGL